MKTKLAFIALTVSSAAAFAGPILGDVDSHQYDQNATTRVGVSCPVSITDGCAFSRGRPLQDGGFVFGHAYVSTGGTSAALPGGDDSQGRFTNAIGINDSGQIIGNLLQVTSPDRFGTISGDVPVAWIDGQFRFLPHEGFFTLAEYINNAGQILIAEENGATNHYLIYELSNDRTTSISDELGSHILSLSQQTSLDIPDLFHPSIAVPEPGSLSLFALALGCFMLMRKKR